MVAEKVAEGELTPDEDAAVNTGINHCLRAFELTELERRVKVLERPREGVIIEHSIEAHRCSGGLSGSAPEPVCHRDLLSRR